MEFEGPARLDLRDAFSITSPHGTLRVVDGLLSWQPNGWGAPIWHVPTADVVGGAASAVAAHELWLDTAVTGAVVVAIDPPEGLWSAGGGNVPDLRGQVALDRLVAALRAGGARILGEPRSSWSRPGVGGVEILWPF